MTNPNWPNWWDVEPFAKQNHCVAQYDCDCKGLDHDVPLIIEKAKEMTTQENTHVIGDPLPGVCNGCGRASWE